MKNKDERVSRTALTLLFAGVTFIILLAVFLVVGSMIFILVRTGVIDELSEHALNHGVTVMLLIILSLIIGAGITFFISRMMMKPMNRIINAMNKVAAGDFKASFTLGKPLSLHPTIKEFTNSFNKMASELDRTEILNTDFINNFSHEFKTPIVSIAGFAKLIRKKGITDEQRDEYAGIIEEESLRLAKMATSVLELSRIENQTELTDVKRVNVSELIRSSVLLLEEKWTAKKIEPDLDFDEIYTYANEELLKQVFINLTENAVKFADEGTVLTIRARKGGGGVSVSVSDKGSVIPPEEYGHIFGKFYQADRSHSSEGSGIGLAVVDAIVRLHRGRVDVLSGKDGVTTFTVFLPDTAEKDK